MLTRDRGRRFSEEDVDELHGLVQAARPPISRALNLREADVVPELDMLTNLLDRQSFSAVLEREILRARLAHHPLSLLVVDVDRLTWLNARIGILAADGVLLELAKRLQGCRAPAGLRVPARRREVRRRAPRLGGRRRPAAVRGAAKPSSPRTRSATPGIVSVTGGITELLPQDDVESFASRADAALAEAKAARRGSVGVTGGGDRPSRPNGTLQIASAPEGIVLDG